MKYNKEAEEACIKKWRELLCQFNGLVENHPAPKEIQKELLQIKETAKNSGVLTFRQVDALVARVDNYLACRYGRTKEHINFKAA